MHIKDNGIVKALVADDGKQITRKGDVVNRTFAPKIYLGVNDSEENYDEWSNSEVIAFKMSHEDSSNDEEQVESIEERFKSSMLYNFLNMGKNE